MAGELTAAARQLAADWVSLGVPLARAKRLGDAVNVIMRAREVTPVDISFDPPPDAGPLESLDGFFASKTWTLHVREGFFSSATTPDEAALFNATTTVAHEARHADQWFSMARYAAGREDKPSVAAMVAELFIPERVARHAHARPLREGDHGYHQAVEWYDEVYGAGAEQRALVLHSLPAAQVALALAQERLDHATDANRKALQEAFDAASAEYLHWYRLYAKLPTEMDSERVAQIVGDALKARLGGQRDHPPVAELVLRLAVGPAQLDRRRSRRRASSRTTSPVVWTWCAPLDRSTVPCSSSKQ